jgi:hypothetical protein
MKVWSLERILGSTLESVRALPWVSLVEERELQ